jgi:hypothetical protein
VTWDDIVFTTGGILAFVWVVYSAYTAGRMSTIKDPRTDKERRRRPGTWAD